MIFLASYFADRDAALRRGQSRGGLRGALPYLAPLLLMWGFCMVLLVWQRDLGAATLYFLVFLALLYLATSDWRYVLIGLGLDQLSVSPIVVPEVKKVIRSMSATWAEEVVRKCLEMETGAEVKAYLRSELSRLVPDMLMEGEDGNS